MEQHPRIRHRRNRRQPALNRRHQTLIVRTVKVTLNRLQLSRQRSHVALNLVTTSRPHRSHSKVLHQADLHPVRKIRKVKHVLFAQTVRHPVLVVVCHGLPQTLCRHTQQRQNHTRVRHLTEPVVRIRRGQDTVRVRNLRQTALDSRVVRSHRRVERLRINRPGTTHQPLQRLRNVVLQSIRLQHRSLRHLRVRPKLALRHQRVSNDLHRCTRLKLARHRLDASCAATDPAPGHGVHARTTQVILVGSRLVRQIQVGGPPTVRPRTDLPVVPHVVVRCRLRQERRALRIPPHRLIVGLQLLPHRLLTLQLLVNVFANRVRLVKPTRPRQLAAHLVGLQHRLRLRLRRPPARTDRPLASVPMQRLRPVRRTRPQHLRHSTVKVQPRIRRTGILNRLHQIPTGRRITLPQLRQNLRRNEPRRRKLASRRIVPHPDTTGVRVVRSRLSLRLRLVHQRPRLFSLVVHLLRQRIVLNLGVHQLRDRPLQLVQPLHHGLQPVLKIGARLRFTHRRQPGHQTRQFHELARHRRKPRNLRILDHNLRHRRRSKHLVRNGVHHHLGNHALQLGNALLGLFDGLLLLVPQRFLRRVTSSSNHRRDRRHHRIPRLTSSRHSSLFHSRLNRRSSLRIVRLRFHQPSDRPQRLLRLDKRHLVTHVTRQEHDRVIGRNPGITGQEQRTGRIDRTDHKQVERADGGIKKVGVGHELHHATRQGQSPGTGSKNGNMVSSSDNVQPSSNCGS